MQQNISKVQDIQKALKRSDKHDQKLNKQISNLQTLTSNVLQQNQDLKDKNESMEKCDVSKPLQDLQDIEYYLHQWNEYDEMAEDQTELLELLLRQLQSENNNLSQDPQQQFENLMRKSQFNQMEATMTAEIDALNENLTKKEAELSRLKKVITNRNSKLKSLSRKKRKSFLETIRISELKDGLNNKNKQIEQQEAEIAELKQIIENRSGELRRLSQESNLFMHQIHEDVASRVPLIDINNLFKSTLDDINEADLDFGIEDVDFDIIMSEQHKIANMTRRVTTKIDIGNDAFIQMQEDKAEQSDSDEFIDKLQNDISELRGVIKKAKSQQFKQNQQILAANEHNLATEDKIEDLKQELKAKGDQLNYLANLIEKLRKTHDKKVSEQQQEIETLKQETELVPMMDLEKLAKLPIYVDSDDEFEHLVKIKLQDLMNMRAKMDKLLTKSSILQRVSVAHNISGTLFDQVQRLKKVITNRNHKLAKMWKSLKDAQNANGSNAIKDEMQEMDIDDDSENRLSQRNLQIAELQQLVHEYKENKQLKEIEAENKNEEFELLKAILRSTMEKLADAQNELVQVKSGTLRPEDIDMHAAQYRDRENVLGQLETIQIKEKQALNTGIKTGTMCFMVLLVIGLIQGILYSNALVNIELDKIPAMIQNGYESVKAFGAEFDFKNVTQTIGQSVFDFVAEFNAITGVEFNFVPEEKDFKYDPNTFDDESKDNLIVKLQRTIDNKDSKLRVYQQEMETKLDNQRFEIRKLKRQIGDNHIEEMKAVQFRIDNKHRKIRVAHDQMVYQLNQHQNKIDGLEQRIEELKIYIQQLIWHFTGPHLLPMNATETVYIQTSNNIVNQQQQGDKVSNAIPSESDASEATATFQVGELFAIAEIELFASMLMGLLFSLTAGVAAYQVLMRLHLPTLPWYRVTSDERKRWNRRDSSGRLVSRFSNTGLRFERVN